MGKFEDYNGSRKMIFALIGNPNCGKTTLFNSLTGATAKTGNWPGVTVEKKEGQFKDHTLVDLPGIYSLSPYSPEEIVSRNYILEEKPDCVINIVDITNLERNLYLTLQLLEMDVPVVLALNMMDIAKKRGFDIDVSILEKKLNIPCIEISALKQEGMEALISLACKTAIVPRTGKTVLKDNLIEKFKNSFHQHNSFYAVKLIEEDELILKKFPNLEKEVKYIKDSNINYVEKYANERYAFIAKELSCSITSQKIESKTEKIDNVLTHRIWGLPIFLLIMFSVFHITFSEDFLFLNALHIIPDGSFSLPIIGESKIAAPGMLLYNLMDYVVGFIGTGLGNLLKGAPSWCSSLLVDGVWGGVGAILSFIPNILVLFLFITILEDCGYMARVAFLMDKIFKGVGLSGKAFIPLISCFGCAVPGIMATKTLKSDKERRMTIMLAPFFSCGAKLPIWTAFAVILFGGAYAEVIVFGVYLYGIAVAIVMAAVLNKILKGKAEPFLMEMPEYHIPQAKNVGLLLWEKCKHYLIKAGTLIAASTVILWVLTNFSFTFQMVENINDSILGNISSFIAPLFYPLGFGRGEFKGVFIIGAFAGLIAKEEVPAIFSSLGVLDMAISSVTPAAIFAYMSFNLLVIPCMAAVSAARGELQNRKHFWLAILFWVITAYLWSMLVYVIASVISQYWWVSIVLLVLVIIGIVFIILYSMKKERLLYANR